MLVGVLAGGTAGAITGVVLAMVGFQALTRGGVDGTPYVVAAVATTGGLAAIAWRQNLTAADLGLGRATWLTGILWSIVWSSSSVLRSGSRGVFRGSSTSSPTAGSWTFPVPSRRAESCWTSRLGTVLVEEFAFRGVLLALVLAETNEVWAVVVTSLLFGLWHVSSALELHESHTATTGGSWTTVLSAVIFTGLSGVVFAILRLWTGSLFPPAALHWAANGSSVVVGWFLHGRQQQSR